MTRQPPTPEQLRLELGVLGGELPALAGPEAPLVPVPVGTRERAVLLEMARQLSLWPRRGSVELRQEELEALDEWRYSLAAARRRFAL